MLRVEASNLPTPRGTPRPRRLLPLPPGMKRRPASAAHHELPHPPAAPAAASSAAAAAPSAAATPDRWSVQLELKDDDIAKLYGQGMTRGAVVWKKGMVEWRPLLVTPELTSLLRRTRTTLAELPSSPLAADELTLPRPARLPSNLPLPSPVPFAAAPSASVAPEQPRFTTVAPTELDVEQRPASPRRRIELVAVAVAAFALAWITHGRLASSPSDVPPVAAAASTAAAPAPACEPPAAPQILAASNGSGSGIPTVSVADLPLAGRRGGATTTASTTSSAARRRGASVRAEPARSASASAPTRAELMGAMAQIARAASGCGERNGPVRVTMSFGGSGVARSIQVSGAGLPAQTRSCIIGAASRARVPAFSGDPVTVSKSL